MIWLGWVGLVLLAVGVIALWKFGPLLLLRVAIAGQRRLAGLRAGRVAVDGRPVAYLDGGSGEALVLLHGFGAEKDNWTPIARYLTKRFRVIAPDLPPFGDTPAVSGDRYSIETQVARVREFAQALGLGRFYLGGNSMGGAIAGAYAATHPEDLLGLWLVAPAGVAGAEESELARRLEAGESPLVVSNAEEFQALMDFAMERPPPIPGPVLRHLARIAIARRPLYQAVFDELMQELDGEGTALETELEGSAVPTLITWGERDRLLDVSGAKLLADAIPGAEVQRLPGIGHVPMVETPEPCADAWSAFAARVAAR